LRTKHAVWQDYKTLINLPRTKKPIVRQTLPILAERKKKQASILKLLSIRNMPSNYGTDYKAKTLSSNEALALPLDQHFTKDQYLAIREQSKKKKTCDTIRSIR